MTVNQTVRSVAHDSSAGRRDGQVADAPGRKMDGPRDPGRMAGYGALLGGYGALGGAIVWMLRRRNLQIRELGTFELITYGLATQHLARLVAKDTVTSVLRSPFTRLEEPAGQGEVNEEVVGSGLRHAVGELLSCPFCLGQWVATGLVAGRVVAPTVTSAVVSVSAVARLADYLQLFYGLAREAQ